MIKRYPRVKLGVNQIMGNVFDIDRFHEGLQNMGRMPDYTHCYVTEYFTAPPAVGAGIAADVEAVMKLGVTPIISCMGDGGESTFPGLGSPNNDGGGTNHVQDSPGTTNANAISTGAQDADLEAWADWLADLTQFGRIIVRPWREMTGNWYPWSRQGYTANGAPGTGHNESGVSFTQGWQYAYSFMESYLGGSSTEWARMKWQWCPASNPGASTQNNAHGKEWYPGDAYVDIVAIDGYNRITPATGDAGFDWRSMFHTRDSNGWELWYPQFATNSWTNAAGRSHVAAAVPMHISECNFTLNNNLLRINGAEAQGQTTLTIDADEAKTLSGTPADHAFVPSGTTMYLPGGYTTVTTANCAVGATSIQVTATPVALADNAIITDPSPKKEWLADLPRWLREEAPLIKAVCFWWAGGYGTLGGWPHEQGDYAMNDYDYCLQDWQTLGANPIWGDTQGSRRLRNGTSKPVRS